MESSQSDQDVIIPGEWHVRYNYSAGKVVSAFLNALKERRILASYCSASGKAYLPPRAYCEQSFEKCDGWKEVEHQGVIEAATIVTAAFESLPPPPYAIAYVRLDGASTALINFVRGMDLSDVPSAAARLTPGAKVRVKFRDDPQGAITDFHYELV